MPRKPDTSADDYARWWNIINPPSPSRKPTMPSDIFTKLAEVNRLIDTDGGITASRLGIAIITYHGLLAAGARSVNKPDVIAREAWDTAEAFIAEAAARLLPPGSFGTG